MKRFGLLSTIVALLLLHPWAVADDVEDDALRNVKYEYAAKFVCGDDPQPAYVRVVPGFYATAINIHNPNSRRTQLRSKVALTFPPAENEPGEISDFLEHKLASDQALEIDCEEIFGTSQSDSAYFPGRRPGLGFPSYIKGFVIIQSTRSLDVTGVYTVAEGTAGTNLTPRGIDVEQIRERSVKSKK